MTPGGPASKGSSVKVRTGPGGVVGPSNRTVTIPRPLPHTHPGPCSSWCTSCPVRHPVEPPSRVSTVLVGPASVTVSTAKPPISSTAERRSTAQDPQKKVAFQ